MKITANCCEITKSVWVYMYTFWEGLLSNEFRNFLEKKMCRAHSTTPNGLAVCEPGIYTFIN